MLNRTKRLNLNSTSRSTRRSGSSRLSAEACSARPARQPHGLISVKIIFSLVLAMAGAGGIYVLQNEELQQKFFPKEIDLSQFATKAVEKSAFKITVEAAGTVDSSRNSTLSSSVEGTTTIITVVPAGSLVVEPLRAEADGIVKEVRNVSSGTPTVVIVDDKGRQLEHHYELSNYSEVLVEVGETVKDGDILIGDLVCELDSASLVDEEKQQQIAVTQAEADLEKGRKNVEIQIAQNESDLAKASLEMKLAQLDLDKYQKGEYIQEKEKIEGEIENAREELTRAQEQYEFTRRVARKGYKSQDDVEAKRLAVLKADLALKVQVKAKEVLENFVKERTIAELLENAKESKRNQVRVELAGEAALAQFKAEVSSRELTYNVQLSKLKQLREQIKACKLIAPQAGQVVYAMESSRRSEPTVVEEGMTVRERQKLINLPDMSAMKVDAKIHESKISDVKVGLPVVIRINAIPGYEYQGVLESVSSVPLPGNWPNYDLKQYEAVVKILDEGPMLQELKPGMSANIEIVVEESSEQLLQMPVQAAVNVGQGYSAWVLNEQTGPERREIKLGRSNDVKFIVESGLQEGDLVITNPRTHFSEEIAKLEAKAALQPGNRAKQERGSKGNARPDESVSSESAKQKSDIDSKSKVAGHQEPKRNVGGYDPAAIFSQRDANGDGVLSKDELPEQMKSNLAKIDTDANGQVSKAEFMSMTRKYSGGGGQGASAGARGAE